MDIHKLIGEATEYDMKQSLEVKRPKSWLKSISAFANTFGGKLIFGIHLKKRIMSHSGLWMVMATSLMPGPSC